MKVVILLKVTKVVLKISIIVILIFLMSSVLNINVLKQKLQRFQIWKVNYTKPRRSTKYVLVWTKGDKHWDCLKNEREAFIDNNCEYDNCYITHDRNLLNNDYSNFHAILFDGKAISVDKNYRLPEKRLPEQLYVFANKDSAANYPVCDKKFDNYFNLTWTHRLDSDVKWTYFTIYSKENEEVGPRRGMKWIDMEKEPTHYNLVRNVPKKKPTALWFVSNCYKKGSLDHYLLNILEGNNMFIHIIRGCGKGNCPIDDIEKCKKKLEPYYFYFAFENSVSEDYVTDIVLEPLWHYVIPVVHGGINYSDFLPPHSYIDAGSAKYLVRRTVQKMKYLIRNKTAYLEYFKWRKHYHFSPYTKSVCDLCAAINRNITKVYNKFRNWWYPDFECFKF